MWGTLWLAQTSATASMVHGIQAVLLAWVSSLWTRGKGVWNSDFVMLKHTIYIFCCLRLASCQDPGYLEKGRRNGNDLSHGQIVTYECTAKGYSLVGNPQLTCNDGRWDSDKPDCKGK